MKKIVVLGGTGTLGRALTRRLILCSPYNRIICFSRDELKQKQMSEEFKNKDIRFVLGDIRDTKSLSHAFQDAHSVFHCAALKHIDVLEEHPEECIKTNVLGSINVADLAIEKAVPQCVLFSTDKAVYPINTYGYSKALAEKVFLKRNETQTLTNFSVYRWGNIIASRGSVIPQFIEAIEKGDPIRITDAHMTRFWLTVDQAIEFVISTYELKKTNVQFPEIKSAHVTTVVTALSDLLHKGQTYPVEYIGKRKGEKLTECLSNETVDPIYSDSDKYMMSYEELKDLLRPSVQAFSRKPA